MACNCSFVHDSTFFASASDGSSIVGTASAESVFHFRAWLAALTSTDSSRRTVPSLAIASRLASRQPPMSPFRRASR